MEELKSFAGDKKGRERRQSDGGETGTHSSSRRTRADKKDGGRVTEEARKDGAVKRGKGRD